MIADMTIPRIAARLDPDSIDTVRIAIRMPAEVKARFDAACKDCGMTMSEAVRIMADRWIAKHEKRAAE